MTKSTKNKVKVGIGIVALLLVVFIAISIWQGTANFPQWFQKQDQLTDDGGDTGDSGLLAPDEQSAKGISIKKMEIPVAQYDDYGVSAAAETALQLSVTVTPAGADVSDGAFSIKFKNASSAWATGKTLSEYVTLSQTDTTHATVSCLKAFGEQIIVTYTVSGENDSKVTADYPLDYAKRVSSVSQSIGSVTLKPGVENASSNIVGFNMVIGGLQINYSDYTVDDTFTETRTLNITDTFMKAASQASSFSNTDIPIANSTTPFNAVLGNFFRANVSSEQFRTDVTANNAQGILKISVSLVGTHSTYTAEYYIGLDVSTLPVAAQSVQWQSSGGSNTGHTF